MSEKSYTVLQGKVCIVTLKGMAGTNYDWCLASMPQELTLLGTTQEVGSLEICGGNYQKHFYFVAKGSESAGPIVELKFELTCLSDPHDVARTCTVEICIIPANSDEFVALDSVAGVSSVDPDAMLKYGYPCGVADSQQTVKYGYPCGVADSQQTVKYGYPCGVADSQQTVKYGYPCGVADSQQAVKYGYPCGVADSQQLLKYGYPCG